MSDEEELIEDERKDRALEDAELTGDALPCGHCGKVFYVADLTEIGNKLYCSDCIEQHELDKEEE